MLACALVHKINVIIIVPCEAYFSILILYIVVPSILWNFTPEN